MRTTRGVAHAMRTAAGLGLALVVASGCGGGADGQSTGAGDGSTDRATNDAAQAILDAEDAMASLEDYTYRGQLTLPEDGGPVAGRDAVMTMKATADGRCETTIDLGDGVELVRRTLGRLRYVQFSPEFLELSEMEPAMKESLRGRWATEPADPNVSCDMTKLADSIDLESLDEVGADEIAGVDAVEYAAEPKLDSDVAVRIWITSEGEPLILRIQGGIDGFDMALRLISHDDGFSIERPADDQVVQPTG